MVTNWFLQSCIVCCVTSGCITCLLLNYDKISQYREEFNVHYNTKVFITHVVICLSSTFVRQKPNSSAFTRKELFKRLMIIIFRLEMRQQFSWQ
jgi:D-alanyl-lipoteichoic acid acyltransferase DltB (MBOAT superfamily)